jgi:chemotaxis protein MotB
MTDQPHPEIIIIKRRSSSEDEHHGGAWKIAFADFMTAMMAFFLVLWIVNATDKNTKTIIARYFNPVKLEESARTPKNIHGDKTSLTPADVSDAKNRGASGAAGPEDSKKTNDDQATAVNSGDGPHDKGVEKYERQGLGAVAEPPDPANPKPTMSEGVLFSDPYRSLDAIAGPASPDVRAIAQSERLRDPAEAGSADPDAFRDPFRPIGAEATADAITAKAPASAPPADAVSPPPQTPPSNEEAKPKAASSFDGGASAAEEQKSLLASAGRLKKELQLQVGALAPSHLGPDIDVQATDEGLLISLTDRLNFAMFPIGSAEPQRQVVLAMDAIARDLKNRPGVIVVRGHTDGHPYKSATYDNWRLSSARAEVAYYMLTRAGLPESRFERIEGYADRRLKDPSHPFAAENRRIEILLRDAKP